MKKVILILLCAFLANYPVAARQQPAVANEAVATFGRLYNKQQYDSVFYMLAEPVKQKMPLAQTKAAMAQVYAQMGSFKSAGFLRQEGGFYYYRSVFDKATMQLVLALDDAGKLTTFRFVPDNTEAKKANEQGAYDVSVVSDKVTIHGTLTVPDTAGKVPVFLLIAGSGPTDRNGNNAQGLKTDGYRQLADSLRAHGIACLRYDKRGVGESVSDQKEEDLRFTDMVRDAGALLKMLKADKRFSSVYIAGHSEGSLVGMLTAAKGGANGFISIAGIADPAYKVITTQLKQLPENLRTQASVIMDSITRGLPVKNVPEELAMLFRPSVQPYMSSWFKYDPCREIADLKVPVLIVQGKKDIQVAPEHADKLAKSKPGAKLVLLSNMTHTLKDAVKGDADGQATYTDLSLPLTGGLVKALVTFIR